MKRTASLFLTGISLLLMAATIHAVTVAPIAVSLVLGVVEPYASGHPSLLVTVNQPK